MSRLDSLIRRRIAQRDILNTVPELIRGISGPVLELGLGNGRTYDHLREILPDREIFAFDRAISAHPACIPDAHYMIVGEIRDTLAFCRPRIGAPAALIHSDLGQGDETADSATAAWLSPLIVQQIVAGGVVVSNQALALDSWAELPLPAGIQSGRYYIYRAPSGV